MRTIEEKTDTDGDSEKEDGDVGEESGVESNDHAVKTKKDLENSNMDSNGI